MRRFILTAAALALLASPTFAATTRCHDATGRFIKCATTTPPTTNTMAPANTMAPMTGGTMTPTTGKVSPQDRMRACAAKWNAMSADDKKKTTYRAFSAVCLKAT